MCEPALIFTFLINWRQVAFIHSDEMRNKRGLDIEASCLTHVVTTISLNIIRFDNFFLLELLSWFILFAFSGSYSKRQFALCKMCWDGRHWRCAWKFHIDLKCWFSFKSKQTSNHKTRRSTLDSLSILYWCYCLS